MRIRPAVLAVATVLSLLVAPAFAVAAAGPSAVGPAIGPPEPSHQIDTPRGPGVRSAGFMDYTDDACTVCDGRIIIGLTPGASYRVAGSPEPCGVAFQKATRFRRMFGGPAHWGPA